MWTDAHIHLYDTRRTTVRWPSPDGPFPKSVYVPDFLAQAGPCGIRRMVSVECTVGGPEEVDDWTLTLTRHDPAVAAVIACADLTSPAFPWVHGRFLGFPKYRGIRAGRIPAEKLKAFEENLSAMAATRARVVELLMEPKEIDELLPVLARHREIRFVLDHVPGCTVGQGPQTEEEKAFLRRAGAAENVYLKVSSYVSRSAEKPAPETPEAYESLFEACYGAFGREKCIYGSDWPVLETRGRYETGVQVLTRWLEPLGEAVTDAVTGENCEKVYEADREGL